DLFELKSSLCFHVHRSLFSSQHIFPIVPIRCHPLRKSDPLRKDISSCKHVC
ncbi:hypothetical protein X975_13452, partial [Stegodyphus mimosarum]